MMNNIIEFLMETGFQSLSALWLPLLLWSWLAMMVWLALTWRRDTDPLCRYHFRVALLAGIPLSILASQVAELGFSAVAGNSGEVPSGFILIRNPIPVESLPALAAPHWDWHNPYLWIGTATLLLGMVSLLRIGQLLEKYGRLHLLVKNTKTYYRHEISGSVPGSGSSIASRKPETLIAFSPLVDTPFTFGWRNPVIMLPLSLKGTRERLRMVLHHEEIHIQRADFVLDAIVQMVKALFWFHPLVALLANESELFREISCDSEVVNDPSVSTRQYARLLYDLLPRPPHVASLPSVGIASPYSTIKERIIFMNTHPDNPRRYSAQNSIIASFLVTLMISGLVACTDIQNPNPAADQPGRAELRAGINTLVIGPDGDRITLNGMEITISEFENLLGKQGDEDMIFDLTVDHEALYGKVTDVEEIMRHFGAVRINYHVTR